ncbi:hypothetical protein OJ253_1766 [Cryptosporidium canis]|uniref:EF-hand domain-containing protein n=1 Tax=Cryptosporidium canis TaxID=195482 RepID=A0A9D5DMY7_9CRYT|nr:hypothetical protein OJ253_1766 [Cryptosporidium canis]
MVLGEVSGLSKPRIDELRQFFRIVDREKTGRVSEEKIIHMLNAIGVQLTKRDKLAIRAESSERGTYSVQDLIKIGEVVYNDRVIARDLIQSLLSISDGKDTISSSELKKHLLKIGSMMKLTAEEVDCILNDIGESNINIYDFVSYCISE